MNGVLNSLVSWEFGLAERAVGEQSQAEIAKAHHVSKVAIGNAFISKLMGEEKAMKYPTERMQAIIE